MENVTLVSAVLGSTLLASLFTSVFAKIKTDKDTRIQNITQERRRWRDRMRAVVAEVNDKFHSNDWHQIRVLEAELTVRLNPVDAEDTEILNSLRRVTDSTCKSDLEQFNQRMALLLKHDWERVKIETGGKSAPLSVIIVLLFVAALCCAFFALSELAEWLNWTAMPLGVWRLYVIGLAARLLSAATVLLILSCCLDRLIARLTRNGIIGYRIAQFMGKAGNKAIRVPYAIALGLILEQKATQADHDSGHGASSSEFQNRAGAAD